MGAVVQTNANNKAVQVFLFVIIEVDFGLLYLSKSLIMLESESNTNKD